MRRTHASRQAFELLNDHRIAGDTLLMMTATHAVVAEPVAARLGFEHWLGSGVGMVDECYTGRADGEPCFQEGKVNHLRAGASKTPTRHKRPIPGLLHSHNDLPLLENVGHPVAVDPDARLRAHAGQAGWPVISLRD